MNVSWNPQESRFELAVNGGIAIAQCIVQGDELLVTHVEVPLALRGGGLASKLASGLIEIARREGKKVVPVCPFLVAYLERHPEARDVLSE